MRTNKLSHLLPGAVALLVSVGAYVGLTYVIYGLQEDRALLALEIGSRELQEEYIQSLHLLAKETREGRVELESYFVSRDNPARFLSTLEEIGRDADVVLEVAALDESIPLSEEGELPYGTISVTYDIEGTWMSVYRFIRMLEHAPYALTVVSYAADRRAAGEDVWEGRVVIEAHTRR